MNQFHPEDLVRLLSLLAGLEDWAARVKGAILFGYQDASLLADHLNGTAEVCESMGLFYSAGRVRDILERCLPHLRDCSVGQFESMVRDLRSAIENELRLRLYMMVPAERIRFYVEANLFGPEVNSHFPSIAGDLSEAGKCHAAGRYTAGVFHLMRVLEIGLRALAATLDDPLIDPKSCASWERLLQLFDAELRKPISQRKGLWAREPSFMAEATVHLRAMKDAWRNPTMHIERNYDEEAALDVWNAVQTFMRHLASKIGEPGR